MAERIDPRRSRPTAIKMHSKRNEIYKKQIYDARFTPILTLRISAYAVPVQWQIDPACGINKPGITFCMWRQFQFANDQYDKLVCRAGSACRPDYR
jgi:hypothetical protein